MEIISADKKYSKDISKLMLKDLECPDKRFPDQMIKKLREHAKEENVLVEFSNPNLISYLVLDDKTVSGFIVGYIEDDKHSMIHYINGKNYEIKSFLLDKFISYCKNEGMDFIITDTFDFFENYKLFSEKGFNQYKKELIVPDLYMFWLKLFV